MVERPGTTLVSYTRLLVGVRQESQQLSVGM